ncbi:2-amino-4-hydroxy-6-hydroxymethyldihydropteridine diphosphokinase [Allomuricauda sp. d1]|uniref:2-amino-4-hydroxy-6- hydroxymethyldihydropteridine diphosphokinase n=1 Tax=Allomuricauda sp. d1 TaxID=3136725 RepID=UPI0031CEF8A4
MKEKVTAYLSLGSNQGFRPHILQQAILSLNKLAGKVTQISGVYENASWGFDGDDFLNLCVAVETDLRPDLLLECLLSIEQQSGRQRYADENYRSRSLDIDIIYYGDAIIDADSLTVPHPKMHERRFVLKPLADIAPQFYHPLLKKDTRNLLQECKDKSVMQKKGRLFKNREGLFSQLHFLAIEGNIGVGKTTLTKEIAKDFNAKLVLERFADNPFLPKFYEDQARYAFPLEMSFLADRYQQFTDDTSQFDLFKTFMVSDYDIYKSLIFANVTLQKVEFDLYRKLFNFMYKEVKKPDIYVYLYQSTERLLENIKKRGRDYEQQIKADYLEKINRGYLDFIKGHPDQNSTIINLKELDFVANISDYEIVLGAIGKKILERIF